MNYIEQIRSSIKSIQDFPKPGIIFKDIQPLLENPYLFPHTIYSMSKLAKTPDYYVGIESRGFIFATALATYMKCGIKLIRKQNKLPPPTSIACTSTAATQSRPARSRSGSRSRL